MLRRGIQVLSKLSLNSIYRFKGTAKMFSTRGADNLRKSLEKEITYEETNYQAVSKEDQDKFLTDNNFTYTEKENSTLLELRKKVDNIEVLIQFQAK